MIIKHKTTLIKMTYVFLSGWFCVLSSIDLTRNTGDYKAKTLFQRYFCVIFVGQPSQYEIF